MSLSSQHRGMFGAGALVVAFLAAFAGGHAGGEPRRVVPVRAGTLTVARDLPPIPAPALGGAPPALAKPAAHARRPMRHRNHAAPSPRAPDQPADPKPSSPAPAPAPRPNRGPGPAQSRGGGRSTGDHSGGSAGSGPVTPAATPVPGQLTPPPVEPPVEEDPAPDAEPAPDEEAG